MEDAQKQDFDTPARAEQQQHRARLRIAFAAVAVVVLLGGGIAIGMAASGTDDTDTALDYARRACKDINLDSPGEAAESTQQAADEADGWSHIADNAARAARLDHAWNELARATDAQYRAWSLTARGADQTAIDAAAADANVHPFEPECRKALVR